MFSGFMLKNHHVMIIQLTRPMYGFVKYERGLIAAINETNMLPNIPGTRVADIGTFCKTGISKSRVVAGILSFECEDIKFQRLHFFYFQFLFLSKGMSVSTLAFTTRVAHVDFKRRFARYQDEWTLCRGILALLDERTEISADELYKSVNPFVVEWFECAEFLLCAPPASKIVLVPATEQSKA